MNVYGNEKFNIYLCDYSVLWGYGLVANASLLDNQYEIVLCEDGGGTYSALRDHYVNNKVVNSISDQPYENLLTQFRNLNEKVSEIMAKTDNDFDSLTPAYSYAFPAAALPNVRYLMQDKHRVMNYLEESGSEGNKTKILSAMGFEGYDEATEIELNFDFESINEKVSALGNSQKENYLKLMYGKYYDDTYNTLTRTTLSDNSTPVPSKKLVFISSRVKSYHNFATNRNGVADFGYRMATQASDIPDSYAELNDMYKTDFLFACEADYQLFIEQLKLVTNYNNEIMPSQEVLDAIRVDCFNYYMDYLFTLKFTYLKYGSDYDIILKGHPSEVIGEHETWTQHYIAGGYQYDKLYDNLLLAFHESDSIGKYIGLVPFGTAAENLAYLGANISLCGLPSSTYTGYDQSIDIKFVMSRVNTSVESDTNLNGRYAAGTLKDHDEQNNEKVTSYLNIGNMYKELINYYTDGQGANESQKLKYEDLFKIWLRKVNGLADNADVTGYDVDEQGFLIKPEN